MTVIETLKSKTQRIFRQLPDTLADLHLMRWVSDQPWWKLVLMFASAMAILVVTVVLTVFFLLWSGHFGSIPTYADLQSIQNNQAAEVYDHRGLLLGKYYIENRVNADFSELPEHLIQALIATEDARFFEHEGIDIRSLGRVLFKSILLSDESAGGGSTISQQLAKNLYPRRDYRYLSIIVNKLREMLIAQRLEQIYPKERILRLYLNTVPFGGNTFGVKVAARRYFDKDLHRLNIGEAAVLVGMLKATSYYNPHRYPERAKKRRNVVLGQMARFSYLDSAEAHQWYEQPLEINYKPESHDLGIATYFREHIRLEIEDILKEFPKDDGTFYDLYRDGLRIHTSIDATMQRYAEASVRTHLTTLQRDFQREWGGKEPWAKSDVLAKLIESSQRYQALIGQGVPAAQIKEIFEKPVEMTVFDWEKGKKEVSMSPLDSIRFYMSMLQTGMLVVEPSSGLVRAWVGGVDHRFVQYDHVKSRRQVGSTIKPIVYTAALRNGVRPCDYFENKLVQYVDYKDWTPQNSNGQYGGYYSLAGALSHSINTIAVDLALTAGITEVTSLAGQMGIRSKIVDEPAVALGAVEASLWEMVQIYATYADGGVKPSLRYLDRIETQDGKIIYQSPELESKDQKRVLAQDEAVIMTQLMQSVVDSGSARRLRSVYGLRGPIAGKTGTTQDQSDGWFLGYTPRLVAGVWVGAEWPIVHFKTTRVGQGANSALPIWALFMQKVKKNKRTSAYLEGSFDQPDDSVMLALDCPHYLPELPSLFDSIADFRALVEFSQSVGDIEPDQLEKIMRQRPRKDSESLSEYSREIRKRNRKVLQKRERKKKRKKFWDKFTGKEKNR